MPYRDPAEKFGPSSPDSTLRPGKRVVFVGAVGYGKEARDFYDNALYHNLAGQTLEEVFERCAFAWGWASGQELEAAVDAVTSRIR
jgi:hypothetical protein